MGSFSVTMDNRYHIDSLEKSSQNIIIKKKAAYAQKPWRDKLLAGRHLNHLVSIWVERARLVEPFK